MVIEFGEYNNVHARPLPRTKVETLSFAYISNNLHLIEEFVARSLGFGTV